MSVNKVNKTTGDLSLLAGGTLYADNPIGSIIPYGGATAPAGWFICDGTELVRATYPELFAVIGTSFGTPSDNTKFKLPDLREATTKGVGLTGKSNNHYDADGLALGEFIDDRVQEHTHYSKFTDEEGLLSAKGSAYGVVVRDPAGQLTGINANGRFGATTEVKAVGVNYIIKAVSVGVPADFMSAVNSALSSSFVVQQYSQVGTEISPTTTFDFTFNVAKPGYKALAVAGTQLAGGGRCTIVFSIINNNTLTVRVLNTYSSSQTPEYVIANVLYAKD
jgi:microcystin-dependent protein